jgi:DNA-binding response OmpR family regulator
MNGLKVNPMEEKIKNILVVDDDVVIVRLIESLLQSQGYQVSSATNGIEALEKIKKEPPDLLILDVILPEINGYDICYRLRFNREFENIPILLVTERNQELGDWISRKAHIGYIHKPISKKKLVDQVKNIVAKKNLPPQSGIDI